MDKEPPPENIPENLTLTHDGYFQETFAAQRVAKAFLKKVLPKEAITHLNLEELTIEGRHLSDDTFKETIADIIYRVPMRGTKEHVNFFVVIEHKSYQDFLTIFQLWGYVYRICRQEFQVAQERDEDTADYRLPPVAAVIVYHGESKFRGATELSELFLPLPGLANHLPRLQAILFDLNSIDDDDPLLNDPEVPELKVVLMVLKTVFRQDVALKIQDVLRELKPYSDDPAMRRIIRATWVYLAHNAKHLRRDFETFIDTVQEVVGEKVMPTMVEIWKAEGKAEGVTEGKAEGKAEAGRNMVLAFLRAKFKRVPKEVERAILAISDPIALESWAAQAATCQSMDEFAEALK